MDRVAQMFLDVNGAKLFFDVEGSGLAPDGPHNVSDVAQN
jgi:hypothetical protein